MAGTRPTGGPPPLSRCPVQEAAAEVGKSRLDAAQETLRAMEETGPSFGCFGFKRFDLGGPGGASLEHQTNIAQKGPSWSLFTPPSNVRFVLFVRPSPPLRMWQMHCKCLESSPDWNPRGPSDQEADERLQRLSQRTARELEHASRGAEELPESPAVGGSDCFYK